MKLYIVGLSGSGKTTLAHQLINELKIPHLDLDTLFVQRQANGKNNRLFYEDVENELLEFSRKDDWIIEGVYLLDDLHKVADLTVYLHPPVWRCLFQQFERLLTDKAQKEHYGFFSNFKMMVNTLLREWGLVGVLVYKKKRGIKYGRIREWQGDGRFIELRSGNDIDEFVQEFNLRS